MNVISQSINLSIYWFINESMWFSSMEIFFWPGLIEWRALWWITVYSQNTSSTVNKPFIYNMLHCCNKNVLNFWVLQTWNITSKCLAVNPEVRPLMLAPAGSLIKLHLTRCTKTNRGISESEVKRAFFVCVLKCSKHFRFPALVLTSLKSIMKNYSPRVMNLNAAGSN